jgi:hypothetical protein
MPEIKNTFTSGKMNKDLDERLIKNGEYRDALNVDVAFSEGSDVGSAQNAYGNIVKSVIFSDDTENAKCIGSVIDKKNETIIWFISGSTVDIIAEYNTFTGIVLPILVDANKSNSNSFLNFSNENLITGVNVLDDFLFFTDNNSEPKKIHVGRMKNGSTNFSTTTKYQNSDGTYTNDVYEELITVIKKYPLNAPKITLDSSIRTGNVKGIARTLAKTSYVEKFRATQDGLLSEDYAAQNVYASTAGSSTVYNLTETQYLERVVTASTTDPGVSMISFATTNFIDGNAYKRWRAVEPGMKIAISTNGSGSFVEPISYHTVTTVDWLNHTVSVIDGSITSPPANGTKVRLFHWSEPYNNDYFWAYKNSNGSVVKKPIGTSSKNNIDENGNIIKDGGGLSDGTGVDVTLTASDAVSGTDTFNFGTGWSYNTSTKTYVYDGTGGGTERYPKITKAADLLVGHIYRMNFTITITTAGNVGFLGANSNHSSAGPSIGINSRETLRNTVGTHQLTVTWKQKQSGNDGMLCLYSGGVGVSTVKIDEIVCLTKARPIRIQPIQFYGNTNYEVNDIIKLQAEDVSSINPEDDKFVDITVKLLEKIQVQNNKKISNTHALAIGNSVVGNEKISNGNLSDLTTWHAGLSGTTDIGTSSAAFFVDNGTLSSSSTASGYVRNVLSESLVASETYKLTYTVTTASTGNGSNNRGYLKLILASADKYNGDDANFGHSNHILLPTTGTYTHSVYFKQKAISRGALSLTELLFFNDTSWNGAIDNLTLKKISGDITVSCGTVGTNSGKQAFDVEIISIDDTVVYNLDTLNFKSKRLQPDAIYEKEFARFSYRWKYLDNEYSAISPFTEVAFLPKNEQGYKYNSKDGYNKSMSNDVRRITLSSISSMPEDVKSVDILYKKSNSASVYILRTIEHDEFVDLKEKDSVVITSEEIKSLLPENQMLRPYDNVPRKALAQEITANRLIYGNYTQQYNYFNTPATFKVKINSNEITTKPLKSLKSIRDYQVGVVFLDNYGRQTPVFTNETGIIKLDQSKAKTSNSIQCSLVSKSPEWATHYKYYIKDSANEYYNLAMDRFYSDIEDENVWISFPSSEINKINENDYVVVKKEHDSELPVKVFPGETIKYKVLDKQANPPEHIKFKMAEIGESSDGVTFSATNIIEPSDSNATKNSKYELQLEKFPTTGSSQFLISSYDLREDAEFLDDIDSNVTNTGVWYDINNRFFEIRSKLNGTVSEKYELSHIYKKSIVSKVIEGSLSTSHKNRGVTSLRNIMVKANGTSTSATTIALLTTETTSKSATETVNNPDEYIKVGMRLCSSESSLDYNGAVIVVTEVNANSVVVSATVAYNDKQEIVFKDVTDAYYFKTKKPFGFDIGFIGSSPIAARRELIDIATASYSSSNTKLPNPQDLKLSIKFYKQTTEDFGEEFKGKFFVKIKRDSFINDFVYKTQAAVNSFKSRDSAKLYYAKSWLLDQGDSDSIIPDTNLTTSSDYVKEILQIPNSFRTDYGNFSKDLTGARKAFGMLDASNTRLVGNVKNGNGLDLNPESVTESGKVDYVATAAVAGVYKRLKVGGTTRGIMGSTVHTNQNSINGYSMKELDYTTPENSGGTHNPSVCIDQSISFRLVSGKVNNKLKEEDEVVYEAAPVVGDGWQLGRTNCSFKFIGINGFGIQKGNLGNLYNFFTYLTTVGQTFRFPQDPTQTVYVIRKADSFITVNTQANDEEGNILAGNKTAVTNRSSYYEKAVNVNIQLDKAIVWSPLEDSGLQSQDVLDCLELNTNSYAVGKSFTSAEEKLNKENTSSTNARNFSACEIDFGDAIISSETPSVFEVLPKEKVDLNLFYETPSTRMIVRDGMSVKTDYRTTNGDNPLSASAIVNTINKGDSKVFQIKGSHVLHTIPAGETIIIYKKDQNENIIYSQNITTESDIIRKVIQGLTIDSNITLDDGLPINIIDPNLENLDYYNCFAFGNGVESNRYLDDYNAVTIDKGPRVSTILDTDYQEEEKSNGLIYSGIYNSKSSFNSLNQFIQGEKITKDLNPDYGSIQKLFTRNTNIIAICEDKTLKILANKDALYNADGNSQLTSTNAVLGQTVPFAGEYGISKNPESFASYGYRCYFSDKKRGAVLRLSGDGLTNVADKGMSKFFRDNLDNSLVVIGTYDSLKHNYNLTLNEKTISFTEKVNGWVSFKSFIPEGGLCYANSYYTFKDGEIWMHNENLNRNNFYGTQYFSTITNIFNNEPSSVKIFKTINYEGTSGWTANKITTDKESGSVPGFIEKEGKYYNFIKGVNISNDVDLLKTAGVNIQGLGNPVFSIGSHGGGNVRSFTHTVTAVDLSSNTEPKKWIINNSIDSTVTNKVIKFNEKTATSITKTVDFYIHPQTVKGIKWKVSTDDFSYSLAESISNFSGVVTQALQANGSIKVTVSYTSSSFPTSNTTSTLTIATGLAYQEQI